MRFVVFAALVLAGACGSANLVEPDPNLDPIFNTPGRWADVGTSCTDAARAVAVPASRRVGYSHGSDDQWAALARTVPGGFGGLLLNRGAMTVYLVDPAQFTAAANAIAAAGYQRPTAYLRGRWDFGQMFDWAGVIFHDMPPIPGLTSFDINEATNRLEFGVRDSASLKEADRTFASMNLPCRLVWLNIAVASIT